MPPTSFDDWDFEPFEPLAHALKMKARNRRQAALFFETEHGIYGFHMRPDRARDIGRALIEWSDWVARQES